MLYLFVNIKIAYWGHHRMLGSLLLDRARPTCARQAIRHRSRRAHDHIYIRLLCRAYTNSHRSTAKEKTMRHHHHKCRQRTINRSPASAPPKYYLSARVVVTIIAIARTQLISVWTEAVMAAIAACYMPHSYRISRRAYASSPRNHSYHYVRRNMRSRTPAQCI